LIDERNVKMKVAAITPVSGPYINARYSAFARNFSDISLSLIELGKTSTIYPWDNSNYQSPYERIILSEQPTEHQSMYCLSRNILRALNKINPDFLVVCGYGCEGVLPALFWSFLKKKPTVLLCQSKADDSKRYRWREIMKALLLKRYNSALVGGKPQKRYLVELGMPSDSIFSTYAVIGNDDFHPEKINYLPNLVSNPYFLGINRFVQKKNLPLLLAAYADYRRKAGSNAWDFVISGDGHLRPELEKQIAELNIQNSVHLPGFLQQKDMLPYFAHASCFIHGSTQEQWGLVVNEAMAAALPVLVSNRCGCHEDLVLENINGFGFDPENKEQLTNLMLKMSSSEVNLKKMGNASLSHIQQFSPDYFAKGLMQALTYASSC
jgi:1,2-diacylglycerol 3-alpha-glucosyltransferase